MTNKNNQTAAIFDLDETLIGSGRKLQADVIQAFARLGYTIPPEQIGKNWYKLAESYGISKEAFDEAFDKRKTWEQSLRDGEVPIFPETYKVLDELGQRGIRASLLSKSIPEYTQQKLDYIDLGKYFEQVLTIHPKEPSKDPAAIEIIRKMNPSTIQRAYFIGDKEEDVVVEKAVNQEFKGYELTAGGIYVNRQGEQLNIYPSVSSLEGILNIIGD